MARRNSFQIKRVVVFSSASLKLIETQIVLLRTADTEIVKY